jgi:Subtilase family
MRRRFPGILAGTTLLAGMLTVSAASAPAAHSASPSGGAVQVAASGGLAADVHRVCAWPPKHGQAACMALVRTNTKKGLRSRVAPDVLNQGYVPADLQSAYNLPSATAGAGRTVALVEAYNDPTAESDLAVYRSQFGLPPCTTANGCFKRVYPSGSVPAADEGWSGETALDLDMVSAICPHCHIELIEAASQGSADLSLAEDVAMSDAKYVSNSWGWPESSSADAGFDFGSTQGVAITVSSGDGGYGVNFPASDPYVISVGGTSLLQSTNARGWDEIAWSGAGSGCSQVAQGGKPPWQTDSGCSNRTVADVSAVADPNTGVYTYNTSSPSICSGWCVFGGTSVAAPIIASVYALAGVPANNDPAYSLYAHSDQLNDIQGGTNSFSGCTPDYLCNAGPGYDGPTGLGTPNGVGAFVPTTGPYDYWP